MNRLVLMLQNSYVSCESVKKKQLYYGKLSLPCVTSEHIYIFNYYTEQPLTSNVNTKLINGLMQSLSQDTAHLQTLYIAWKTDKSVTKSGGEYFLEWM